MCEPKIAQNSPYPVEVEKGQTYYWCACGLSDRQPFCSGAHKGTPFKPVAWTAAQPGTVYFCGCKRTRHTPLCDGSHRRVGSA